MRKMRRSSHSRATHPMKWHRYAVYTDEEYREWVVREIDETPTMFVTRGHVLKGMTYRFEVSAESPKAALAKAKQEVGYVSDAKTPWDTRI